ncbi:metallophosphoesterase [candidate division KSB1 bacterium]|nr:metallophosphoesterase [candidate division KSB1 bacterium]
MTKQIKFRLIQTVLIAISLLFLLPGISVNAAVIEVEAGDEWFSAISEAIEAGDTLLLVTDGGIYNSAATVVLPPLPLTLKAAPDLVNKPILKTEASGTMLGVKADLTVIGLAFDGAWAERGDDGTYRFIQVQDHFGKLSIYDSDFYNLRGYGLTSSSFDIDTLIIDNCLFYDFDRIPVYFKDRQNSVKYTRIANSSFYRIDDIAAYVLGSSQGFEVSHCTFSGLTNIALYPKEITENLFIRDNIIVTENSIGAKVYGDNPIVQYNLFFGNNQDIEYMGSGNPDFVTGNVFDDPLFEDAAAGRLALHIDSPAVGAASDEANLGDPRWGTYGDPDSSVAVTFSVTVPANTPEDDLVYLAGTFNDWNPGAQVMEKIDSLQWHLTLSLEKNTAYEYKYTRGDWESVEKDSAGEEIANRTFTTGDSSMTIEDVVEKWADVFDPVEPRKMPPILTFYDNDPQHHIAITYFSDVSGSGKVFYGINDVTENTHIVSEFKDLQAENDQLVHIARLTGLSENTTYKYQIATGDNEPGPVYTFKTAAYKDEFMFVVGGDNQLEVYQPIVGKIAQQEPAFMIHAGDIVVDGVKLPEWFTFLETFEELSPYVPIMPVYGNHDSDSPTLGKLFTLPSNGDPENEFHWYSFRYNNVYFIGLDVFRSYIEGSDQYVWLENELQNIDSSIIDHIFVCLHHGPYASLGYHGPNTLASQYLIPLFEKYGITATFSGHNHFYERSVVNGIPHFISGGLSIHLKDFTLNTNPWSGYLEKSNHFLKVYVNGSKFRVEMMRADGTVADVYESLDIDGRDIDFTSNMVEPMVDEEGLMTDTNLKLDRLYITHDSDYYYFGFDALATDKGVSYGLYIDTDNIPGSGGTTDRWGKAIIVEPRHLPEVQIYAYHEDDDTWSSTSPSFYHWDANSNSWITGSGGMARLPENGIFAIDNENRFFEIGIPHDAPGLNGADNFHVKLFSVGNTSGAGVSAVLPNDDVIRFTEENTSTDITTLTQFWWYNAPDTTPVIINPIDIDGDPSDWLALGVQPVAVATNTSQVGTQYRIDSLMVHMDENNLYLGFITDATDEKMHFGLFIDTDHIDNSGGNSNPWGAFTTVVPEHLPEIAIFAYHNEMGGWSGTSPQYYIWTGSSWVRQSGGHGNMPPGGLFAHKQSQRFVEMLVPKDSPGLQNVDRFHISLYNFGMTKYVAEALPSDPLVSYTGQNSATPVELRYFAYFQAEDTLTQVIEFEQMLPGTPSLQQNYPNPFNPVTTIRYQIIENAKVKLSIINVYGQTIRTLVNQEQPVGYYTTLWDGKDAYGNSVASGIYFYRLATDTGFAQVKKMVLVK